MLDEETASTITNYEVGLIYLSGKNTSRTTNQEGGSIHLSGKTVTYYEVGLIKLRWENAMTIEKDINSSK